MLKRLILFAFLLQFLPFNGISQNYAKFDFFSYRGNDDFYKNNPLPDEESFYNPILPGFYPDPSICRKGSDYFLVNSTFCYFPGIPIFHSNDLVNWRQIGNVINRTTQLSFEGFGTSDGVYAPAIEYNPHNDTFYLVCTNVGKGGNFVVKTKNPFAGNWSDPIWLDFYGIDPSLFFDTDGKAYIVNNDDPEVPSRYSGHKAAWLQEFDTKTDKMVGPRKVLRDGGFRPRDKPIWIEGPHVYKIKGKYYLMTAEGGTGDAHSEVIYRSDSVWGTFEPYTGNPILTQRRLPRTRTNPTTNTGHADIIDTPEGDWWAVFLGCRPFEYSFENLGRETFMMPVKWSDDGFPYLTKGNDTIPWVLSRDGVKRDPSIETGNFKITDHFEKATLDSKWLILRTPQDLPYSLSQNNGSLSLNCLSINTLERKTPAAVFRRIQHHKFEAITKMIFQPQNSNEGAGLIVFRDEPYQYNLMLTQSKGKSKLVLLKVSPIKNDNKTTANAQRVAESKALCKKSAIYLKVVSDGPNFEFYYSLNNKKWIPVGDKQDAKHLTTQTTGGFIGTTVGMYATGVMPK